MVEEAGAEDFRTVAATWVVQQVEPLVPAAERLAAETRLAALTQEVPARTAWWFAGVLADQVQTLPADDPWRNLAARAGDRTRGEAPPDRWGASNGGSFFGAPSDGHDLVPPTLPSPMTDVGLAALSGGISRWASAALAFAADGWETCGHVLLDAHEALSDDGDQAAASALVTVACDALRWATWRRRIYTTSQDDWFPASGFSWTWRAELLAAGADLPPDELKAITAALDEEAVSAITYAEAYGAVHGEDDSPS